MKKMLLAINPVAGKGRAKAKLFEAVEIFTKNGYRVTVMPTQQNRTEDLIKNEAKNYQTIVAIGGDGTLNSVASGIIQSSADIPMGYIPMGSTNDFGMSLGLSKSLKDACLNICEKDGKYIDIGRLNDKYFVYIACTGMFTDVSYMTSQQLKNALGHSAYFIKAILELPDLHESIYTVTLEDGEVITGDFLYAGVSNSLRAGGVVTLNKDDVSFDDGLFELTLIKNSPKLADRVSLATDILNSNLKSKHFIHKKVKKATFLLETPKNWCIDGENGGENLRADFEVLKHRLKFIY